MRYITLVLSLFVGLVLNAQVGINTDTPLSTLDINGNLSLKVETYSGGPPGTATPINDGIYLNLTPTAGNDEFLLPNAALVPGRIYIARNISDTTDARIFSAGGDFFAGNSNSNSVAPIIMQNVGVPGTTSDTKTLIFISDGINWTYGHLGFF